MNHALGVQSLVEAIDSRNRNGSLNDDLIAAEIAAAQSHVGFGTWVIGQIRKGFALIGIRRAERPETLEESVARLASVSPHLLDDIGLDAKGHLAIPEEVPAGRGLVRTRLVESDAEAMKPAAEAIKPVAPVGISSGYPFGNIAAAE